MLKIAVKRRQRCDLKKSKLESSRKELSLRV